MVSRDLAEHSRIDKSCVLVFGLVRWCRSGMDVVIQKCAIMLATYASVPDRAEGRQVDA